MSFITELRERRATVRSEQKTMLDKAIAEKRDLNPTEQTRYDKLEADAAGLAETIQRAETQAVEDRAVEARFAAIMGTEPSAQSRAWLPGLAEFRQLRADQRAVGTSGAFIPVAASATYFDQLRKRTAVLAAGPVIIPIQHAGSLKIPNVTASVSILGKAEAAALGASDPTLSSITLDPKKFGAYTLINREAIEDSAPQLREVVANSLIRDTAVELDAQLVTGDGTGQNLLGLRNVVGVTAGASTGTNGGALTFAFLADTLGAAEAANVDPDRLAWIMHSRTWASVRKLADTASRPIISMDPTTDVRPTLWGHPVHISNSLSIAETKGSSSDCSSIILADMSEVVVGVSREVELMISEDFKFDTDQVAVRVTARYDIGVPSPTAVTVTSGVRP
jgi:HK97 family phage major capsid protein